MYNHRSLKVITPPASEPVTLAMVKQFCRIDTVADDLMIPMLITAAREWCEGFTGRKFMPQTLQASWDRFPMLPNMQYSPGNPNALVPAVSNMWPLNPSAWAIELPEPPVIAVNSVQYYDQNQTLQTLPPSQYQADLASEPARLTPVTGSYWPECSFMPAAVIVQYQSGYSTSPLPNAIMVAIMMMVAYLYQNREAVIVDASVKVQEAPMGVKEYLWTHRQIEF